MLCRFVNLYTQKIQNEKNFMIVITFWNYDQLWEQNKMFVEKMIHNYKQVIKYNCIYFIDKQNLKIFFLPLSYLLK